jgi:hypothetical protein
MNPVRECTMDRLTMAEIHLQIAVKTVMKHRVPYTTRSASSSERGYYKELF